MVSKVAHGTERVNRIKDFKVLLASNGLNTDRLHCTQGEATPHRKSPPPSIYTLHISDYLLKSV
jgi:hypothetical protein